MGHLRWPRASVLVGRLNCISPHSGVIFQGPEIRYRIVIFHSRIETGAGFSLQFMYPDLLTMHQFLLFFSAISSVEKSLCCDWIRLFTKHFLFPKSCLPLARIVPQCLACTRLCVCVIHPPTPPAVEGCVRMESLLVFVCLFIYSSTFQ